MSLIDLIRERLTLSPRNKRLIRYLMVGASGFVINQAVFILAFNGIGISYIFAGLLGSGVSIFANYVMNDSWTWKGNSTVGINQWLWRGVKYGATRIIGVGIGTTAQILFVEILLVDPVTSNILKVGVGVLWGFGASEKWVWNSKESSQDVSSTQTLGED